jgi:hypothetical protein
MAGIYMSNPITIPTMMIARTIPSTGPSALRTIAAIIAGTMKTSEAGGGKPPGSGLNHLRLDIRLSKPIPPPTCYRRGSSHLIPWRR